MLYAGLIAAESRPLDLPLTRVELDHDEPVGTHRGAGAIAEAASLNTEFAQHPAPVIPSRRGIHGTWLRLALFRINREALGYTFRQTPRGVDLCRKCAA